MLVRRAVQVLGSALVLVSMSLVASPSAAEEPVDVDKRSWCTTDSRPFLHDAFAGGLYPENAEPPTSCGSGRAARSSPPERPGRM